MNSRPWSRNENKDQGIVKGKRREEVGRQYKKSIEMDFASSSRAAEYRTRWRGIVVKSSVAP